MEVLNPIYLTPNMTALTKREKKTKPLNIRFA